MTRGMPVIDGSRIADTDRPGTPGCGAIGRDVNPRDAALDAAVRRPPTAGARLLVATIAAGACAVAGTTRVFAQPEAAYETVLAEVTLPAGPVGRVSFPPWAGCTPVSLPASPRTIDLVERVAAEARAAGGGEDYTADGAASLAQVLPNIVASILGAPATLAVPAVAVYACNRARQHRRIAADRDASH